MSPTTRPGRRRRLGPLLLSLALGLSTIAAIGASLVVTASPSSAASGPCNYSVTGGGSVVVTPAGDEVVGVVAGSSSVTFDCNTSTGAAHMAEASLLAGVATSTVSPAGLADTGNLGSITASGTDTGCPAAVAGQCSVGALAIPATFAASDPNALCPPNQAQINAGMLGCAIAATTGALAPISGAEVVLAYSTQTTPPAAPTIQAAQTTGVSGDTVTISDQTGHAGNWWADGVQAVQAGFTGTAALPAPATCAAGGGYGDVPSSPTAIGGAFGFLKVNWFASGNPTAIPGSAAGVAIANTCYDGTTVHAPVLGGTIPVPAGLTVGGTYTVYLCELDATPYPSNDASVAANCGTSPLPGSTYIDASFTFTVEAAAIGSATPNTGGIGTSVQVTASGFDPQGTALQAAFTTGSNSPVSFGTVPVTGSTGTCGAVTASGAVTCTIAVTAADTLGSNPIELYQSAGGPTSNLAVAFTVNSITTQCTASPTCSIQQVLTLQVLPGTLSATEATSSVSLGSVTLNGITQQATGSLQVVSVNDSRGTLVGWTMTGQFLGEFVNSTPTGNTADNTICVESVCPGTVTGSAGPFNWIPSVTGNPQATAGPATTTGLSTSAPRTLCSASTGGGGGITDCSATVSLAVPPSVTKGAYTAVLQLTVS